MRQLISRDPDATVRNADERFVSFALNAQADAAALLGVLGRVRQQIAENLHQSLPVAHDVQLAFTVLELQAMPPSVEGRAGRLDGVVDHVCQDDAFSRELDLAGREARDVEQVVDETDEVAQLALHDVEGAVPGRVIQAETSHELEAVRERRERIANLVGERRDEFILPAVRFLERRLGLLEFGDVDASTRDEDRLASRPVKDLPLVLQPSDSTVGARHAKLDFETLARANRAGECLPDLGLVVRVRERNEFFEGHHVLTLDAEQSLQALVQSVPVLGDLTARCPCEQRPAQRAAELRRRLAFRGLAQANGAVPTLLAPTWPAPKW